MKAQKKLDSAHASNNSSPRNGNQRGANQEKAIKAAIPKVARRKISPAQVTKQQIAVINDVEQAINFACSRLRTLGEDYERLTWVLEDTLAQLYATRDEAREQFSFDDLPEQLFKIG